MIRRERRFASRGLPGLEEAPERGPKPSIPDAKKAKHAPVRAWLEKHPRVHVHFTPTGSSWLNLVERFFRQLTDEVVREGSFASVHELVTAINVHVAHHNLKPQPYRWKAGGATILEKIHRARLAQAKAVL